MCLNSRSSGSVPKKFHEKALQSLEKGFFWKNSSGKSREEEKKKRKMKVWAGTLKLKQVENPSIGLDLSHRSKSIGPRREWKEERAIREEEEEDSRAD